MKKFLASFVSLFAFSTIFGALAFAQDDPETLVVTPVNTRGWSSSAPIADTRPGGTVALIQTTSPPLGTGALQLVTDNTTAAKAQYIHAADTLLSSVTSLAYSTKQNSASFVNGAPSYQLAVFLDGVNPSTFTTFVYEPYNNTFNIIPGAWQAWDVDAGTMWSSRTASGGGACAVTAGGGGPPFYSLTQLQTICPNAKVVGYGVNIGSFNPAYNTEVDQFVFQNTTYDFELYSTPTTPEDCKKGGWSTFNPPSGLYKNQGQCVSSTVPAP